MTLRTFESRGLSILGEQKLHLSQRGDRSGVLRQDERGVRAKADAPGAGHRVCPRPDGLQIIACKVGESRTVAVPVAVEAYPPQPGARQPDTVGIIAAIREIGD